MPATGLVFSSTCLQACGANDDLFYVELPNDTPNTVVVAACGDYGRSCGPVPTNVAVEVSQMVPCGDSLGDEVSRNHDWPYSKY